MAFSASDISVIIPVSEDETEHLELVAALEKYDAQVIISSAGSRAKSLNAGAAKAKREYLWFLHADSRPQKHSFNRLIDSINHRPAYLHYFDLEFSGGGPGLMWLNSFGANFRSRVLGIPFGDQGLCIRKDLFYKIGGFPEDAKYGEDHLFVWQARRLKIFAIPVGTKLITSARRYKKEGWLKLTLLYQYLWIKQAWPQFILLMQGK